MKTNNLHSQWQPGAWQLLKEEEWDWSSSAFFMVQISHPYMTTGKTIALNRWTFVSKVMSLLFNMLSKLVITFLPRSKHLLISWLQSPLGFPCGSAGKESGDFGAQENKVSHCSHCFPSVCYQVMGLEAVILVFWMLSFKSAFSLPSFTFIKRLFRFSSLSAIKVVSSAYLR